MCSNDSVRSPIHTTGSARRPPARDAGAFVGLSQIPLDLSQIHNRARKNIEFKYSIKAMVLPDESALDAPDPL
jgi:hypothetical protein